jgi:hypothetical protein
MLTFGPVAQSLSGIRSFDRCLGRVEVFMVVTFHVIGIL